MSKLRNARRDEVEGALDLGFASPRWQAFVAKRRAKAGTADRRADLATVTQPNGAIYTTTWEYVMPS